MIMIPPYTSSFRHCWADKKKKKKKKDVIRSRKATNQNYLAVLVPESNTVFNGINQCAVLAEPLSTQYDLKYCWFGSWHNDKPECLNIWLHVTLTSDTSRILVYMWLNHGSGRMNGPWKCEMHRNQSESVQVPQKYCQESYWCFTLLGRKVILHRRGEWHTLCQKSRAWFWLEC
jgi:hypothetical protein